MGDGLFIESNLEQFLIARDNYLHSKKGMLLPDQARLYLTPLNLGLKNTEAESAKKSLDFYGRYSVYAFNLSLIDRVGTNELPWYNQLFLKSRFSYQDMLITSQFEIYNLNLYEADANIGSPRTKIEFDFCFGLDSIKDLPRNIKNTYCDSIGIYWDAKFHSVRNRHDIYTAFRHCAIPEITLSTAPLGYHSNSNFFGNSKSNSYHANQLDQKILKMENDNHFGQLIFRLYRHLLVERNGTIFGKFKIFDNDMALEIFSLNEKDILKSRK